MIMKSHLRLLSTSLLIFPNFSQFVKPTVIARSAPLVEYGAPWGLARISHRDTLSLGTFHKYLYSVAGGKGVDVFVIDTGIYTAHADYEDRAIWAATIPLNEEDDDGVGHGTSCAGIIAGKKYGVAKRARVFAVKVICSDGTARVSDLVKGVEFAIECHLSNVTKVKNGMIGKTEFKGSVINLSLGVDKSAALLLVVDRAVDAGLHVVVAAGNENDDACKYSPTSSTKVITIGASTIFDGRAGFSNYGNCTDVFAPGVDIMTTSTGFRNDIAFSSGTSAATPHVAGLIAYFLSTQSEEDSSLDITPQKMKEFIISIGSRGKLTSIPMGTDNLLAWNGAGKPEYSSVLSRVSEL